LELSKIFDNDDEMKAGIIRTYSTEEH